MNEPKLRFCEFSESWKTVLLSDISQINPKTKVPDEFEYVDLESVVGTEITSHRLENRETAPSRAQRVAKSGDIFYQTVRPYQKNNCYFSINDKMPYVFSTGYAQLRPSIDGYFLFSVLQQEKFVNDVLVRCTGTSYPAINSTDLASISIKIPSSQKEQHDIGMLFKTIDEKIALKQKKYAALVEAKKGLLQKIFSQEIRFKRDDGGEYPEWDYVTLGDIANLYNGYAFKSSTYDASGEYNIITIANVTGEKYISLDNKTNKISALPDNIAAHQILKPNDILISMTGNVGRVSLNTGNHNLLNQRVGLLRTTENNSYVYYAIANDIFKNDMVEKGQGGAQPNIKKDDILDYEIQLPCKDEQQKITDFLSVFDEKIEAVRKELERWKTVKKGLLQQMFC